MFQEVARALGAEWRYRTAEDVFREIARVVPGFAGLSYATLLPDGGWPSAAPVTPRIAAVAMAADGSEAKPGALWLLAGGTLFADGGLSQRSGTLAKLAGTPRARLSPAEASRLQLSAGDRIELTGPAGAISLPLELDDSVPAGAVFVPYAGAELNRLGAPTGAGLRVGLQRAGQPARPGPTAAVER
jgi:predicted molibdopterin-dependent oxidoreductase YjgC